MTATKTAAAALLLGLVGASAAAQERAPEVAGPIDIAADALEVQQDDGLATFTGNVVVIQGELILRADRVWVNYADDGDADAPEILAINAEGNVFLSTPAETAQGDVGVYDVENALITLVGAVVLTRGETAMRGNRLQLDLTTGVSRMEGDPEDGGRVRGRFVPGGAGDGGDRP